MDLDGMGDPRLIELGETYRQRERIPLQVLLCSYVDGIEATAARSWTSTMHQHVCNAS